jgi:hypothetical protein
MSDGRKSIKTAILNWIFDEIVNESLPHTNICGIGNITNVRFWPVPDDRSR